MDVWALLPARKVVWSSPSVPKASKMGKLSTFYTLYPINLLIVLCLYNYSLKPNPIITCLLLLSTFSFIFLALSVV